MHTNRFLTHVISLTAVVAALSSAGAQQPFKTPDEAADALVTAARSGDRKALTVILGPGSAELVSSGDAVQDASTRQVFTAA